LIWFPYASTIFSILYAIIFANCEVYGLAKDKHRKYIMNKEQIEDIRKPFQIGEYAISDHAIIEARKDGIEPETINKLEWVAVHGKVIEEYPERQRILIYAEVPEEKLPVHIVVDYSFPE